MRTPRIAPHRPRRRKTSTRTAGWLAAVIWVTWANTGLSADLAEVETLYRTGKYAECAQAAGVEITSGFRPEAWYRIKARAELAVGDDSAAEATIELALRRFPWSLPLRLLAYETHRDAGREQAATAMLDAIGLMIRSNPARYDSPEGRIAIGRFFLIQGADARKVLDQFFDVAQKQAPELLEAYIAPAELALERQDLALAASTLGKAAKVGGDDPRYHYLTALAFSEDDRKRSDQALVEALKLNPRLVDGLLLLAEHQVDLERYAEAEETLQKALDVNPREARAWAFRAVLAHLRNDAAGEAEARRQALVRWEKNPEVDHLIGRELSKKYRFAEGAAYQRKALAAAPGDRRAKLQLAQDLLRLGEESEGWKLAAEVFAEDGYNVVAYNLTTLRDRLAGFRTLTADGFVVRMDPREADLYGARVLDLLGRARRTLTAKYGIAIPGPITVEIFPQKKEFAVRTFGLPGAEGLLGVCFGTVVTANSPASRGETPANWEAVLWHEFCHVVTLGKTRNKMPRWLSEGISVYEEEKQDPAWRTAMTPRYRAMTLGEDFTPLSQLSGAFLAAKSPMHVQYAYFESALAVEFLVEKFGLESLKGVLDDLGTGVAINDALPGRTKTTLVQLDADFASFAKGRANALAPGATWDDPPLPPNADSQALARWLEPNPRNFPGRRRLAAKLVAEEKWTEAKPAIEALRALDPDYVGEDNAYVLLAAVSKRLGDVKGEHDALEALAVRDGSATPAYLRLGELDLASSDWAGLAKQARRLLAVNPLVATPHRWMARASEQIGQREEAIAEYRALALLDETDPAEQHYHLAKLLAEAGQPVEARREVLKALEDAPRFREAHRLLLELARSHPSPAPPPTSTPPAPPSSEGPPR
jgi:tetratricopeptide (TPR) repeat protein